MAKQIQINLSNKLFYALVSFITITFGIFLVNAYSGNVGHTSTQIDVQWSQIQGVPTDISDGQVDWSEVKNIPADFADGTDNTGTPPAAGAWISGTFYPDGSSISCTGSTYYGSITMQARVQSSAVQIRSYGSNSYTGSHSCDSGWVSASTANCVSSSGYFKIDGDLLANGISATSSWGTNPPQYGSGSCTQTWN